MPVTSPVLDDLDYQQVSELLRARIPVVAPEWTDHNESDPGITLIQLFAHLSEHLGYRLNRVPEKTYVELLKLVGVQLRAAVAAQSRVAFTLSKPARANGVLIASGTSVAASGSGEPPVFETDVALDVLPAQIAALVTTRGTLLDINSPDDSGPSDAMEEAEKYIDDRFSIAWDGKTPKLSDMPTQPVQLFGTDSESSHSSLYIGLAFNQSTLAGFKGARAALHIQLDEDEQPDPGGVVEAGTSPISIVNAFQGGPAPAEYHYYRPPTGGAVAGTWMPLVVLADETDGWMHSGELRFEVPTQIGPIPVGSWQDVESGVSHPLPGKLKTPIDDTPADVPISGWLRVRFGVARKVAIRSINFNTVMVSNLKSVSGERLGNGNSRPGQTFQLSSQNVLSSSLELVSRDQERIPEIMRWTEVADFDSAGPEDRVFVCDSEAGVVVFGDGIRGFPPQTRELLIATEYRHGGGANGDVATGAINKASALPGGVSGAVNVIPARGGRNAESLEEAKRRAPRAFRMRERAVTNADYQDAALMAPGVQIARAAVLPLVRPYPEGHLIDGGLARGVEVGVTAPGALTVVVVPKVRGSYPMPTSTELSAVATHLNKIRLLTTEVHVTTPQYLRIYDLQVAVRAAPGFTSTLLREQIGDALQTRFHVLSGGSDGDGFPFGGSLHHADLVASVFSVPGVDRVEALSAHIDGRTAIGSDPAYRWRLERVQSLHLTNCLLYEGDIDRVVLAADEVPFVDVSTLLVNVVGTP